MVASASLLEAAQARTPHARVFYALRLGSDVMCEYPLQDMLDFHKARKAEATILVTKVSFVAAEAQRTGIQRTGIQRTGIWRTKRCLHFQVQAANNTASASTHLAAHGLRLSRVSCPTSTLQVDDWSKYGVVVMDEYGQVQRFVEKPKDFVGDKINAGGSHWLCMG